MRKRERVVSSDALLSRVFLVRTKMKIVVCSRVVLLARTPTTRNGRSRKFDRSDDILEKELERMGATYALSQRRHTGIAKWIEETKKKTLYYMSRRHFPRSL